jgi:hypothetical protein
MLVSSLPHRGEEHRRRLASGFLGVTTWQSVCTTFRMPYPPWPDAA